MPRFSILLCCFLFSASAQAATSRQSHPALAGTGSGFVAAWIEESAGHQNAVAASTTPDGTSLDDGIALDQRYDVAVALARGSAGSLVVWSTFDTIYAQRLSSLGNPLDAAPLTIAANAAGATHVAAVWDGSRYFMLWLGYQGLYGSFLGVDGTTTVPRLIVAAFDAAQPDVAWDGHQFLVAYSTSGGALLCSPCPVLPPFEVHLLRVAADGTAVDVNPVLLPGLHRRAHLASSGEEFLATLDNEDGVSFVTVREAGGTMHFSDEVSLFHWFSDSSNESSDVLWDGTAYVLGWRYAALDAGWVASARIDRSWRPSPPLVTFAGRPDSGVDFSYTAWEPSFAIAVNGMGNIAMVTSEGSPTSDDFPAHLYDASLFTPMPLAPPAPRTAVTYVAGNTARIEWQSDDAPGFLIERSFNSGKTWPVRSRISGNVRSTTVRLYSADGNLFQVRALGAGGMSQPTIAGIGSQQRRHAAH